MAVNDSTDAFSAPDEVLHPGTRAIFRHWETIRGESAAPSRSDLDLRALRKFVPWLFILERRSRTGNYSWRLAGTKVCELWRRELTGSDAFVAVDRFERDTIRRLFDGVTLNFQPCALRMRLTTSLGQAIGVELVGLPLRARDGGTVHVFGAIMPFRETASLGYDRLASIELASARTIWTEPVPGDRLASERADTRSGPPYAQLHVIPGGRNS